MSAAKAVLAARAAGMSVSVDGNDLILVALAPPRPEVLDLLSRHKSKILLLLAPANETWSPDDWQAYFEERAGIAEFDGGLRRDQAEARAFKCCVAEWLNCHAVTSPPGRCLACGATDDADDQLVPYGTGNPGHAWLHSRCWGGWYATLKGEAISALAAMGIAAPANFPDDFGKNGGA